MHECLRVYLSFKEGLSGVSPHAKIGLTFSVLLANALTTRSGHTVPYVYLLGRPRTVDSSANQGSSTQYRGIVRNPRESVQERER